MSLELKYDNCINCGAQVRGHKCAYCGTEYKVKELERGYSYSSGYYYTGGWTDSWGSGWGVSGYIPKLTINEWK